MESKFGNYMSTGSIPRHYLSFSIPMIISNMLNVGYSIINTVWLGNFVGKEAVGAIAVSFPITFLLIAISSGVTAATTILMSQYFGAKDYNMMEKLVNNSFSISLILGILLTVGGIISSDFLLSLMQTPEEILSVASGYLKISFLGFTFMYMGQLITSILHGIGDTMLPLVFMGAGVAVNAVLDPFLIIGIGPFPKLGLNGAAYASVAGQVIAMIIALAYLNKKNTLLSFKPARLIFDRHLTFLIFKLGVPTTVQQSLISIGSAVITSFVNSFGASATIAFGAASRIDTIVSMLASSLGMAASVLTGQNLGAQKPERVKEVLKWGIIITSGITLTLSAIVMCFPLQILSIFVHDPSVLDIGVSYLQITGSGYIFFAIMFISNGIINGSGNTVVTMIFSILSLWVIRVPLAAILATTSFGILGIWLSVVISYAIVMTSSLMYYCSGKWNKAVTELTVAKE